MGWNHQLKFILPSAWKYVNFVCKCRCMNDRLHAVFVQIQTLFARWYSIFIYTHGIFSHVSHIYSHTNHIICVFHYSVSTWAVWQADDWRGTIPRMDLTYPTKRRRETYWEPQVRVGEDLSLEKGEFILWIFWWLQEVEHSKKRPFQWVFLGKAGLEKWGLVYLGESREVSGWCNDW